MSESARTAAGVRCPALAAMRIALCALAVCMVLTPNSASARCLRLLYSVLYAGAPTRDAA